MLDTISYICPSCNIRAEKKPGYYDHTGAVVCIYPCYECQVPHTWPSPTWLDKCGKEIEQSEIAMAQWPFGKFNMVNIN